MKITTTTKYGGSATDSRDGFKIAASAEISDKQLPLLASIGLASVLYRGGASVINDALGVRSNSKAEFSDADAAKINAALTKWAKGEDSPIEGGFDLSAVITRHVHGEGAEPKYFEEKKIVNRHVQAKDVYAWATDTVGFKSESDAELTVENVEFLKAVKAYKQRILANS